VARKQFEKAIELHKVHHSFLQPVTTAPSNAGLGTAIGDQQHGIQEDGPGQNCDDVQHVFRTLHRRKVYSILLVIDGGVDTLATCRAAQEDGTTITLVEGSGRGADLLAYAWKFLHDNGRDTAAYTLGELESKSRLLHSHLDAEQQSDSLAHTLDIVAVREGIAVYNPTDVGDAGLDEAVVDIITQGLAKSKGARSSSYERQLECLELFLLFRRTERARLQLYSIVQRFQRVHSPHAGEHLLNFHSDMVDGLLWAMRNNNHEFVDLVTKQLGSNIGQVMQFLSSNSGGVTVQGGGVYGRFFRLYEPAFIPPSKVDYFRTMLSSRLAGGGIPTKHQGHGDTAYHLLVDQLVGSLLTYSRGKGGLLTRTSGPVHLPVNHVEAYHHLLVWAVLMTRYELATTFWVRGGYSIPNAILASKLLRSMSKLPKLRRHLRFRPDIDRMQRMASQFEQHAMDVLSQCYAANEPMSRELLWAPFASWSNFPSIYLDKQPGRSMNCISLAMAADNHKFISHPAVDAKLEEEWHRLMFSTDIESVDNIFIVLGFEFQRGWTLYKKFWLHLLAYLIILGVFCAVVVWPLSPHLFSTPELVLLASVTGIAQEELQQLFLVGARTWWRDGWNRLDACFILAFLAAIAARIASFSYRTDSVYRLTRALYGIDLTLAFLRVFRYCAVSAQFGPKLVMIGRMMKDIEVFLGFFIVLLFAYGFSMQAFLDINVVAPISNNDASPNFLAEFVFLRPIFQLFGEVQLDDYASATQCQGTSLFTACHLGQWLVPVWMILYLFVVNILLLNLLIAMFARRYVKPLQFPKLCHAPG